MFSGCYTLKARPFLQKEMKNWGESEKEKALDAFLCASLKKCHKNVSEIQERFFFQPWVYFFNKLKEGK